MLILTLSLKMKKSSEFTFFLKLVNSEDLCLYFEFYDGYGRSPSLIVHYTFFLYSLFVYGKLKTTIISKTVTI